MADGVTQGAATMTRPGQCGSVGGGAWVLTGPSVGGGGWGW